jgi:tetratricopeptide (TPR) repeat protein
MLLTRRAAVSSSTKLLAGMCLFAGKAAPAEGDVSQLIEQGRQLGTKGDQQAALAAFQKALQQAPRSFEAHLSMGTTLDLLGRYSEAQRHFRKSIEVAPDADAKTRAARAMAISYAFERKPAQAAKYEKQIFDSHLSAQNYTSAPETGDELARIYLECGELDQAYDWYQRAYNTALKKPDASEEDKDLWGFRWESGQARVTARRGAKGIAEKELAAAKAFVDRLHNPQQEAFLPYLAAYINFHAANYHDAIADLENANRKDLFVLELLARTYEKAGQRSSAADVCNGILKFNMHNIANAFARPTAKRILAMSKADPGGRRRS